MATVYLSVFFVRPLTPGMWIPITDEVAKLPRYAESQGNNHDEPRGYLLFSFFAWRLLENGHASLKYPDPVKLVQVLRRSLYYSSKAGAIARNEGHTRLVLEAILCAICFAIDLEVDLRRADVIHTIELNLANTDRHGLSPVSGVGGLRL